jgi:hypothetical protein
VQSFCCSSKVPFFSYSDEVIQLANFHDPCVPPPDAAGLPATISSYSNSE